MLGGMEFQRIGDAERDEAMKILQDHFANGRLTYEEIEERIDAVMAAKTIIDLQKLFRDLPAPYPSCFQSQNFTPPPFPGYRNLYQSRASFGFPGSPSGWSGTGRGFTSNEGSNKYRYSKGMEHKGFNFPVNQRPWWWTMLMVFGALAVLSAVLQTLHFFAPLLMIGFLVYFFMKK